MKSWIFFAIFAIFGINAIGDSVSITGENDLLFQTDKYYTHGTRITYTSDDNYEFLKDFYPDRQKSVQVSIGQFIYTPLDKLAVDPILDDRPYCGWLYEGIGVQAKDNYWYDSWELDIGTVGPDSLAEPTQKKIHEWTHSVIPLGWKNQIKNEICVDFVYQKKYRWDIANVIDIIPYAGGSVGNAFTYGNAGGFARIGWNLPNDFGIQRMEPTTKAIQQTWLERNFAIYGYVDYDNRYVLRNITLDGNTFKDSQSIEKKNYVTDFEYGINIRLGEITITYGENKRSKEFKVQEKSESFSTVMVMLELVKI